MVFGARGLDILRRLAFTRLPGRDEQCIISSVRHLMDARYTNIKALIILLSYGSNVAEHGTPLSICCPIMLSGLQVSVVSGALKPACSECFL